MTRISHDYATDRPAATHRHRMKQLLLLLAALIALAYPILVYVGIEHFGPLFFALLLFAMALIRFCASLGRADLPQILTLVAAALFSLVLAITGNATLLRLYPVMMSAAVALLFGISLTREQTVIEGLARRAGKSITPQARIYIRKLTAIWVILLLINAAVALYLALYASLGQWAFYTGFLSYVLIALVSGAELLYRRYYISRYGA